MQQLIGNTEYSVTSPSYLTNTRKNNAVLAEKQAKTDEGFLNLIQTAPRTVKGTSGTQIINGQLFDEDTNVIFQNLETGVDEYRQMKRVDPVVRAVLNALKQPILRSPATIKPASQDNEDLKIAEEVRSNLFENDNFTYNQWLKNILYYFDYGFEVLEKEFEIVKGKWRWKMWHHRRPETIWEWNSRKGELKSVVQQAFDIDTQRWVTTDPIKQNSLFHIANEMEGLNFQGESVVRSAYRSFLSKDRLIRLQNVQAERGAVGVPHGIMKSGNETKKNQMISSLQNIRSHEESYIVSSEGDFEIGFFGGKDFFGLDLKPYIEFHNNEIVEAVGAGFTQQAKGDSAQGSRAKQEADIDFFALALESHANGVEDIVNGGSFGMQHIRQLVDLNHKNVEKYPQLKIAKISKDDVGALMTNLALAKSSGLIDQFTDEDEAMGREKLGWAEREMTGEERAVVPVMQPQEEESVTS